MIDSWNTAVQKQNYILNGAGSRLSNPILSGLPFAIVLRFNRQNNQAQGYAGLSSPPTTSFTFTQDESDELRHVYSAVAGSSPFGALGSKTFVRVVLSSLITGQQTAWEKSLWIQQAPSDIIQVFDIENEEWVSVDYDVFPSVIPVVSQMCGIRFMPSWVDEFGIQRYGGAKYVSIYDFGTSESDFSSQVVSRITEQEITVTHEINLVKHETNEIETHDFYVTFKTEKSSANVVTKHVRLRSLACYGFQIRDPYISQCPDLSWQGVTRIQLVPKGNENGGIVIFSNGEGIALTLFDFGSNTQQHGYNLWNGSSWEEDSSVIFPASGYLASTKEYAWSGSRTSAILAAQAEFGFIDIQIDAKIYKQSSGWGEANQISLDRAFDSTTRTRYDVDINASEQAVSTTVQEDLPISTTDYYTSLFGVQYYGGSSWSSYEVLLEFVIDKTQPSIFQQYFTDCYIAINADGHAIAVAIYIEGYQPFSSFPDDVMGKIYVSHYNGASWNSPSVIYSENAEIYNEYTHSQLSFRPSYGNGSLAYNDNGLALLAIPAFYPDTPGSGFSGEVRYDIFYYNGSSWSLSLSLELGNLGYNAYVVLNNNNVGFVVYQDGTTKHLVARKFANGTWEPAETISSDDSFTGQNEFFVDPKNRPVAINNLDHAVCIWALNNETNGNEWVQAAWYICGGWKPPQNISENNTSNKGAMSVALNDSDQGIAFWDQGTNTPPAYANTF